MVLYVKELHTFFEPSHWFYFLSYWLYKIAHGSSPNCWTAILQLSLLQKELRKFLGPPPPVVYSFSI